MKKILTSAFFLFLIVGINAQIGSDLDSDIRSEMLCAKYYALVIAIEEYQDPAIPQLSNQISSSDELVNILSSRYTFSKETIKYLKNPGRSDIVDALAEFRDLLKKEDNLLIYFTGHGYWDDESGNGYWLPADARKDSPDSYFSNIDLHKFISVIVSKHILLIDNACFGGKIFRTGFFANTTPGIDKLYRQSSRTAMTSGILNFNAKDSYRAFNKYLLKYLQDNSKDYLSSAQLFFSMRTAILNNSDYIPLYGAIMYAGDEGGDFIFVLKN